MVKNPLVPVASSASLSARSAVLQGEDRAGGRGGVAEPLEIGLGERAFPGEGLAGDEPGPVAVALALGHLGQSGDHPLDVCERRHGGTLPLRRGSRRARLLGVVPGRRAGATPGLR